MSTSRFPWTLRDSLRRSAFVRDVMWVSGGTAIAQAIMLGILPVLTRLYTPDDFGVFSLFLSVTTILATLATFRYEQMILLTKSDAAALNVVKLIFLISAATALTTFVVVFWYGADIAKRLGEPRIAPWLYGVPVALLLLGFYEALRYLLMRVQRFRAVSQATVLKSAGFAASALAATPVAPGLPTGGGLIIGHIFSNLVCVLVLLANLGKATIRSLFRIRARHVSAMAWRHKGMAATLTVSHGIANVYSTMPTLLISHMHGSTSLGFFGLAERVVGAPAQLVAVAIGDVYRQRAAQQYRTQGHFHHLMRRTLLATFAIGIVPYAIGIAFAPEIFEIIFGAQWRTAGVYASILLIGGFVSFVTTPVDKSAIITNSKGIVFFVHLGRLTLISAATIASLSLHLDLIMYLSLIVASNIIFYVFVTLYYYKLAMGRGRSK